MQNRSGVYFVILIAFWLVFSGSSLVFADIPAGLTITPELVVLELPRASNQNFRLSSTLNPMKIIIDSELPLPGFPASTIIKDVVLREIRYTPYQGGGRLVLDFNYRVPDPIVSRDDQYIRIEIAKTYVQTTERMVVPGVIYGHQRRADSFGPNVVNYLVIDTQRRGMQVRLALGQNRVFGSEHVSTMAERLGAVAAVNGAFFAGDGRPLGVFMINGELISEPYARRTALGIGPDILVMDSVGLEGKILKEDTVLANISGINRSRLQDELLVYTSSYGTHTKTNDFGYEVTIVDGIITNVQISNSVIPKDGLVLSGHGMWKAVLAQLSIGDRLDVQLDLDPPWGDLGVEQIIGGGPRLLRDGSLYITGEEERFRADVLVGRAPRTALGITADQRLLLVTVNGRQPNISVGMTLNELAKLLLELGAIQAMNLDGGGSTTMVINNLVLNLPSDGKERPVSNAIMVLPPK